MLNKIISLLLKTNTLIFFFGFIIFISCKTTYEVAPAPDWLLDQIAVFPSDRYISARGESTTKEGSRTEASTSIARYFKSEINTRTHASSQAVSDGNATNFQRSIDTETQVSSSISLFGLEYTEPFYLKKQNSWACVAYIDREKAWNQFKPSVDNSKSAFYSLYQNGEKESDPFTKCVMYKKANKVGAEFLEKLDFARILNPKKEAEYEADRKTASELSGRIEAEKEKCTVYLSVSGDYGNTISSSLSKTLSKNGFKIAKTQKEAVYTASASVEDNATGNDPISIYPNLDLKIESKSGKTIYATEVKVTQKSVSYTLENAQKKAFPILAEDSEKTISAELSEKFGN